VPSSPGGPTERHPPDGYPWAIFGADTLPDLLRARLTGLRALLALPSHDPELALSQLAVLAKQIPLLFIILTANALALAASHAGSAPRTLTIVMPALFCLICLERIYSWRRLDIASFDGAAALARLNRVMTGVVIYGTIFTAWSLMLFPYGDAYARCHVAFYMAITVISCIMCLMHLRGAALLLTFVVVLPYTLFFLLSGNLVLIAMAANFLLVAGGLIMVMLRNYQDFAGHIVSQRETQRLSDENLRLANLDSLTGLPNRRRFLAELDQVITAARREAASFAVAIIDLDRFKSVNDTYGHAAGDRLLEQVGARLNGIADPALFLARLGGDEFGAILKTAPDEAAVTGFGARVQALLEPPFAIGNNGLATIGCSIGAASYPQTGRTAEELFERADYALYDGKQHHKGETILFSQELETQIRTSSQIEQALRNADLETELWLAFQPIVDAISGRTLAFEALARWNSPEFGAVSPGVFIPIAEHAQLMNHMTKILFAKMLEGIAFCPDPLRVGFNLSAHDLCSRATMASIRAMVEQSGIPPGRIVFEITESALLQDFELASETIAGLHALGARIALDDFGVGFSSLGYVHRLNLDKIKIDRSFVADIDQSDAAPKIIRSIIDLCRNLELECVIEGVETDSQLAILLGLGARHIQGYLFGKPMPAGCIAAHLSQNGPCEQLATAAPHQRRRTILSI
jgi:diguanylate cyclase (GGDEF)-like protein